MFLKKKNIVVEVPDINKNKIEELLHDGYNEYKTERVVQNGKQNSNYRHKRI